MISHKECAKGACFMRFYTTGVFGVMIQDCINLSGGTGSAEIDLTMSHLF